MTELQCGYCNKIFSVPDCHAKSRKNCSRECSDAARRKGTEFLITGRKECGSCHDILPLSEFVRHRRGVGGYYTYCKKCAYLKYKEYAQKFGKTVNQHRRDWMRTHRLVTSNGVIHKGELNKRPYPQDNSCELCHVERRLAYHHWDDSDFSKGMWICIPCHSAVHWLEKHSEDEYILLKQNIECQNKMQVSRKVA